MMFQGMSLRDRFTCALVCKAWAEEAAAATRSVILRHRVQDLSSLQRWLEKHGDQVLVLQLHDFDAALTALPCAQLQDLLLRGRPNLSYSYSLYGRVWRDIAAATKLTSVSLEKVQTASQQAYVVSALTALPDLEQLTWRSVECGGQRVLTDSKLLLQLTKLTALKLDHTAAPAALEHLGLLTRLQDLSLAGLYGKGGSLVSWAAAGCPGLQELRALTRLELLQAALFKAIPASVSQLTALQQLTVPRATPTALNQLSTLTRLTCLCVQSLELTSGSTPPPLQLPALQQLEVGCGAMRLTVMMESGLYHRMPMSYLDSCTQLRTLKLSKCDLMPYSPLASTMLQPLELDCCNIKAALGAADPVSWQQVFPGPGRLPHLTSLLWVHPHPALQHADIECVAACCSSLQVLHLDTLYELPSDIASALTQLSGLTSLFLKRAGDQQQCRVLAQLTGLRKLRLVRPCLSIAGLRQLAALDQLTFLAFYEVDEFFKVHFSQGRPDDSYAMINKVCVYRRNFWGHCLSITGVAGVGGTVGRP